MIEELNSFSPDDVQDLDRLMHELAESSFCDEKKLSSIVSDENSHLYVLQQAQDQSLRQKGRIVGCACLCVAHSPEFTLGFVEAVTVLEECRGQHLGRRLMEHLMDEASRIGVQRLHLTSSPRRIAANELYRSLGFRLKETTLATE